MKTYLAHRSEDGRTQPLKEHLEGTATLCAAFANSFGAADQGKLIGLAHDLGKGSAAFQERLFGGPKVDHATWGALACAKLDLLWGAHCVAGHHGGLLDGGSWTDQAGDPTLMGRLKKGMDGKIPPCEPTETLHHVTPPAFWGSDGMTDAFFTRMMYSCLVDADYLDTEQFMQGGDLGRGLYDSLPTLLARLEAYVAPWWSPKTPLNQWRCEILRACLDKGAEPKGRYTLTVPTGGGKTVASLAFALRHAVHHGMDRVIYVIPYTSIIEQNAAIFREILGADNVIEHHSSLVYDPESDLEQGRSRQALAAENWDAPVIVTTAVQFFESLYANRPSACRKLHNMANSVIIFDEAQMMPTAHLKPCVTAIAQLVAHYGTTAVLCTATQPALEDLFLRYGGATTTQELCPDVKDQYRRFRRVSFSLQGKKTHDEVAAELAEKTQVLCIVNSRKAAQEIYENLPEENRYHLSTLMYPLHRRTVLEEIRQKLQQGQPCRVVSTSLIEAGVDIDFPAVYREMAGLDSILQAAGRCNREGKRRPQDSVVTIFQGEGAPPPLLKVNIGAAKEALSKEHDPGALSAIEAYFSSYRSLSGEALDKAQVLDAFQHGIAGCGMPFRTVAERFHLIDSPTKTVYIPLGGCHPLHEKRNLSDRTVPPLQQWAPHWPPCTPPGHSNQRPVGPVSPPPGAQREKPDRRKGSAPAPGPPAVSPTAVFPCSTECAADPFPGSLAAAAARNGPAPCRGPAVPAAAPPLPGPSHGRCDRPLPAAWPMPAAAGLLLPTKIFVLGPSIP